MESGRDYNEPASALVHETLDTLGSLVVEHVRLAKLEIEANLRILAVQVAVLGLATALALAGYGLACAALCLDLASVMRLSNAMLLVGGIHVLGGTVLIAGVVSSMRRRRFLASTVDQAQRSVETIVDVLREARSSGP